MKVEQYAFHNEDGGAGQFRAGKGVVLDYRVVADEVFLTYAASRTISRPWSLHAGQEGSNNYAQILRADGSIERHHMCTTVRAAKGEVIRLVSATGGGVGDPHKRDRALVELDVKNGYITSEQAAEHYGFRID